MWHKPDEADLPTRVDRVQKMMPECSRGILGLTETVKLAFAFW
jgi:hypothetical protein